MAAKVLPTRAEAVTLTLTSGTRFRLPVYLIDEINIETSWRGTEKTVVETPECDYYVTETPTEIFKLIFGDGTQPYDIDDVIIYFESISNPGVNIYAMEFPHTYTEE